MYKVKKIAYIALGANLSNPKANFQMAIKRLNEGGVTLLAASSLWHSPAWPSGLGHPDYVNAVVKVETRLPAQELLLFLHEIEASAGRIREVLNAPRALDLDIVDYDSDVCTTSPLLPHPRVLDRPFVLLPLLEIEPNWRHPATASLALEALGRLPMSDVFTHHVIERKWLKSLACV